MKPVVDVHTIESMTLDFRTLLDFLAASFVVPEDSTFCSIPNFYERPPGGLDLTYFVVAQLEALSDKHTVRSSSCFHACKCSSDPHK